MPPATVVRPCPFATVQHRTVAYVSLSDQALLRCVLARCHVVMDLMEGGLCGNVAEEAQVEGASRPQACAA